MIKNKLVNRGITFAVIILFIGISVPSTGNISKVSSVCKSNNPPYVPSNPYPPNGSTNVSISSCLHWTGGDPDGDLVTYNIYFGNTSPPPLVISNISITFFCPDVLEHNTTYYWKIVAEDEHGAKSEGPLWHFTTVVDDAELVCWGELTWNDVKLGDTVSGMFWIRNNGRHGTLYWRIDEWPSWGIWDFGSFFPKIPPRQFWIVFLNVTAPNQKNASFTGSVKVVNILNEDDFGIINVSLTTQSSYDSIIQTESKLVEVTTEICRILGVSSYNVKLVE
ncbi:MAG: hypothetical protein JSW60_00745 [Thermoplasmatales archaeon]|nr:MAG: hypothetical protein JSW60_00745 [Thermoplasmatales archaeon]